MSRGAGRTVALGPLERGLLLAAPALTALTLAVISVFPARDPDDELQLVAPGRAIAGTPIPVRLLLYAGLNRVEGPSLAEAPAQVELRGPGGTLLGNTTLRPGFAHTLEGSLRAPSDRVGPMQLIAHARYQGTQRTVERDVIVTAAPQGPIAQPAPRTLPALRSLALGPLHTLAANAPSELSLHVRGGACVPEAPCELLVHVGEPAAVVVAEGSASVSVSGANAQTATEAAVAFGVTTHGPEAELALRAERDGNSVARRSVRLPVALGSLAVDPQLNLITPAHAAKLALIGADGGCIIDAYRDGRWLHSQSARVCAKPMLLPFALEPGLWRLQLRSDPFSADSAAVRSLYVLRPGETRASVLAQLAAAALAVEPQDALARALHANPTAVDPANDPADAAARYLLAILDSGIYSLPAAVSGRESDVVRIKLARMQLRRLGLLALALCALTLVSLVLQRGLRASAQAGVLLADAFESPRELERARLRRTLVVLAVVLTLLLGFAAIAAYFVARSAGA